MLVSGSWLVYLIFRISDKVGKIFRIGDKYQENLRITKIVSITIINSA